MVSRLVKRIMDIVLSFTALVIAAPIMIVVALAIRLSMGSPVLFRQQRPGLRARPFEVVKFRTMTDARDSSGEWLPQSDRLTPLGHFLRRTSLDELPQLWSILKGDMSVVGPRPLLMEYLPNYTPEQARRHEVKPGLTGWAQVNGRQLLGFDERFKLDVWYIDNWSLSLDLRIMLMTAKKVLTGDGVPPAEHVYDGVEPPAESRLAPHSDEETSQS